jgi:hypothetical protein
MAAFKGQLAVAVVCHVALLSAAVVSAGGRFKTHYFYSLCFVNFALMG